MTTGERFAGAGVLVALVGFLYVTLNRPIDRLEQITDDRLFSGAPNPAI